MTALVELRVLDGPNLYVSRPAVKLTLDAHALGALPEATVQEIAKSAGLTGSRPGEPGSGQRQRFSLRLLVHLTRQVAAASGTVRLAVRARPGTDVDHLVLAYPWRRRGRAEALAHGSGRRRRRAHRGAGGRPRRTRRASGPRGRPRGRARSAAAAHPGRLDHRHQRQDHDHPDPRPPVHDGWAVPPGGRAPTASTSTADSIEEGDWSGPGGARLVLEEPVDVAVLETARGGLLLRGMGVAANDVSVVTNVSADHLGLQGIDTVDQLAEVKAVITQVTRPQGWAVLNGEDPRVFAMRSGIRARPWVFALSPDSPAIRQALNEGGRAATVLDGDLVLLGGPDRGSRPPAAGGGRAGDAWRGCRRTTWPTSSPPPPRPSPSASRGKPSSRGCAPSCPTWRTTQAA